MGQHIDPVGDGQWPTRAGRSPVGLRRAARAGRLGDARPRALAQYHRYACWVVLIFLLFLAFGGNFLLDLVVVLLFEIFLSFRIPLVGAVA